MAWADTARILGTGAVGGKQGCEDLDARIWYNLGRIDSSVHMASAMAVHLTNWLWDIEHIVKQIAEWEAYA